MTSHMALMHSEKPIPLEDRIYNLKENITTNLGKLVMDIFESDVLGFYEKLYFITECGDREDIPTLIEWLFETMSPGEIIYEMAKPLIVKVGTQINSHMDFSLLFNDSRYVITFMFLSISNSIFKINVFL